MWPCCQSHYYSCVFTVAVDFSHSSLLGLRTDKLTFKNGLIMINYTSGEKCHKIYERSTAILFYCDKTTSEVSFKTCFLYVLSSRLTLFFKVWKVRVKNMNVPNHLQIGQAIQRSCEGTKRWRMFWISCLWMVPLSLPRKISAYCSFKGRLSFPELLDRLGRDVLP